MAGRPLHLLIVSNTEGTATISGADRDWVNILNALGPERVRVTWVGISNTESLRAHLARQLYVRFVNLHFEPFYELFHQSMYRRRSAREWPRIIAGSVKRLRRPLKLLRQAIRSDPPDIVVTNTSVVLVGTAFARRARLPHVWCVKEFLDPAVAACRRFAWFIERLSDVVIVPSAAMAGVFSERVRVLPDGNDLALTRSRAAVSSRAELLRSLRLPPEQLVIAQTGVLSWAKGQRVTARACVQLASEVQRPCSLLFLGSATRAEQEELRAILSGAPQDWQSSVRFVEYSAGDFSYLAAADVVVHPSVLPDPYPNAVREALILGKPVVGSRGGGIPELITDGLTGILVEPDDPAMLASALRKLIESSAERERIGSAARRFAETTLDINVRTEAFFQVLLSVLTSRKQTNMGSSPVSGKVSGKL